MSSLVIRAARAGVLRFGIVLAGLVLFPFPLGLLPGTAWLGELLVKPLAWATEWVGQTMLGLGPIPTGPNGSGDTLYDYVGLLTIGMLAVLGTVVWSVLDRQRTSYPRLVALVRVWLRYSLAYAMLSYGLVKVFKQQFPDLHFARLAQPVGEMPPMLLLWSFMGYSKAYTMFAGFSEVFGGLLLLWRRTATLGALLVVLVMTNVVVLNFCYDVCVKLYSTQLLIMAVAIASPGLRRVVMAGLGRAVPEVTSPPRRSARLQRTCWIAKLVVLLGIAWQLVDERRSALDRNDPVHELFGAWVVDRFVSDGVEHPPLLTDGARWRMLAANPRGLVIHPMTGDREVLALTVDAVQHTMALESYDNDETKVIKEVWRYVRPTPDRLEVDAVHRGRHVQVWLHLDREAPLLAHGFHWVSNAPTSEAIFN